MDSEMRAVADALNSRCDGLMDVINMVAKNVAKMGGDPYAPLDPLPAPALTEQAIVDALKADPAMAGRVMAEFGSRTTWGDRQQVLSGATAHAHLLDRSGTAALQSLAVALAAASYRG